MKTYANISEWNIKGYSTSILILFYGESSSNGGRQTADDRRELAELLLCYLWADYVL